MSLYYLVVAFSPDCFGSSLTSAKHWCLFFIWQTHFKSTNPARKLEEKGNIHYFCRRCCTGDFEKKLLNIRRFEILLYVAAIIYIYNLKELNLCLRSVPSTEKTICSMKFYPYVKRYHVLTLDEVDRIWGLRYLCIDGIATSTNISSVPQRFRKKQGYFVLVGDIGWKTAKKYLSKTILSLMESFLTEIFHRARPDTSFWEHLVTRNAHSRKIL